MKGDILPTEYHVSRYSSFQTLNPDGTVSATAFLPGKTHLYLSVNCLELSGEATREKQIDAIRNAYEMTFCVKKSAKIAVLNIGQVCSEVFLKSEDRRILEARHEPTLLEDGIKNSRNEVIEDPTHCGIFNIKFDDELIAEIIAENVIETFPVRP